MTTEVNDAALAQFFRDKLLPLARRVKARGDVFPMRPDPTQTSYWIDRPRRSPRRVDFEEPSVRAPEELGAKLAAMWRARGRQDLADLAPQMQRLAADLRRTHNKQDDVSPFVYVMY